MLRSTHLVCVCIWVCISDAGIIGQQQQAVANVYDSMQWRFNDGAVSSCRSCYRWLCLSCKAVVEDGDNIAKSCFMWSFR